MNGKDISYSIIGAAMEVHSELGPGVLETAYEACLAQELEDRGFHVQRQLILPVRYKGLTVNAGFRVDLLVDNEVIVELKAVKQFEPIHFAQIHTYLKLANLHLGLLINFNTHHLRDGIKRYVL